LIIYSVDDASPSILADIEDHAVFTVETLLNGYPFGSASPMPQPTFWINLSTLYSLSATLRITRSRRRESRNELMMKLSQIRWGYAHI
jgi:hypothetical protein